MEIYVYIDRYTNTETIKMKTEQITIKTNAGDDFSHLAEKVSRYSDVIEITTAFFRNNDNEWQTSITIRVEK